MFAKRLVKKTYLAITTGVPEPLNGDIEPFWHAVIKIPEQFAWQKKDGMPLLLMKRWKPGIILPWRKWILLPEECIK